MDIDDVIKIKYSLYCPYKNADVVENSYSWMHFQKHSNEITL